MKHLSSYLVQGLAVVAVVAIVMSVGMEWWEKNTRVNYFGRPLGEPSYRRCPYCTGRVYGDFQYYYCTKCSYQNRSTPIPATKTSPADQR